MAITLHARCPATGPGHFTRPLRSRQQTGDGRASRGEADAGVSILLIPVLSLAYSACVPPEYPRYNVLLLERYCSGRIAGCGSAGT